MSLLDPADRRPVHFVGIAGAGMSGLAELLARRGVAVQGTDGQPAGAADLIARGIEVRAPDAGFVDGARTVVYSSAVPATHPELVRARALGIPVVRRAEALGEAVRGATLVAIAGTHGKTTTTVMTTEALAAAGFDPVGIAGGRVAAWGSNLRPGDGPCVVVEADEYDRSFLALTPTVAVVLNVEADHLDIYRDLDDITRTFTQFLQPARSVVLCRDDAGASALPQDATRELVRYAVARESSASADAVGDARLVAHDVVLDATGARARVTFDGRDQGVLELRVPGLHNVRNALAALGAGLMVGACVPDMLPGLARFTGVERRFQSLGEEAGRLLVDDYAHHPTEVAATIAAARAAHPARRLVVAFQPHLYSRTRDFAAAFAEALVHADVCALCEIYPAREQPIAGVSAALIAEAMQRAGRAPAWTGARADCADALAALTRDGDLVITMGAGDITQVGPQLLARWRTP
jgi:UDP-N-acetylmuramate--alanine ligase